jgi:hypothetical protein
MVLSFLILACLNSRRTAGAIIAHALRENFPNRLSAIKKSGGSAAIARAGHPARPTSEAQLSKIAFQQHKILHRQAPTRNQFA